MSFQLSEQSFFLNPNYLVTSILLEKYCERKRNNCMYLKCKFKLCSVLKYFRKESDFFPSFGFFLLLAHIPFSSGFLHFCVFFFQEASTHPFLLLGLLYLIVMVWQVVVWSHLWFPWTTSCSAAVAISLLQKCDLNLGNLAFLAVSQCHTLLVFHMP